MIDFLSICAAAVARKRISVLPEVLPIVTNAGSSAPASDADSESTTEIGISAQHRGAEHQR